MGRVLMILEYAVPALALLWIFKLLYAQITYSMAMRSHGCKRPPSYPDKYPVLGLDWHRSNTKSVKRGDMYSLRMQHFRRLGRTFQTASMGNTVIHTMDPKNIQTVLATEFTSFGVSPTRQISAEPLIGRGVFTSDGKFWEWSRSLGKPLFARAQLSDFSLFEKHVNKLLTMIPKDGSIIDLQPLLKRLFLDTSTELFFGESIGALPSFGSPDSKASRFLSAFDAGMRGMRERKDLGPLYFIRGSDKIWKEACAEVHTFVDEHIQKAMERKNMQSQGAFVDILLSELGDPLKVRSQLLNMFQAARDSTAISASNMFFNLARHPLVWNKLREEILAISGPLSFELFKSMKYLQCVLKESMRLSGPTGLSRRICVSPAILPRGGGSDGTDPILIQPGDIIMINFHAMHRDKQLWGNDAEVFCPERWQSARPRWEYLPFLGGPRICPAQQMALGQCAYLLVRFLQEFKTLENRDEEMRFVEEIKMLCESRNGVKVALYTK